MLFVITILIYYSISMNGTLSLVDLAGSERLDRSGAVGAQMKETVAINKSLSALADVFVAIANKQAHIPFRNSKLTYLLQPALSGDGKTLMVRKEHDNFIKWIFLRKRYKVIICCLFTWFTLIMFLFINIFICMCSCAIRW